MSLQTAGRVSHALVAAKSDPLIAAEVFAECAEMLAEAIAEKAE